MEHIKVLLGVVLPHLAALGVQVTWPTVSPLLVWSSAAAVAVMWLAIHYRERIAIGCSVVGEWLTGRKLKERISALEGKLKEGQPTKQDQMEAEQPVDRDISLRKAAIKIFEELEDEPAFRELLQAYKDEPDKLARRSAEMLLKFIERAPFPVPVYGRFPPLERRERISKRVLSEWRVGESVEMLVDQRNVNKQATNITLKYSDLMKLIQDVKETNT